MKKDDCEKAIRHLCHVWAKETGIAKTQGAHPSPQAFIAWVRDKHPVYLGFRSVAGVEREVETWLAQELTQTWRY
jgi:hypothetical protein